MFANQIHFLAEGLSTSKTTVVFLHAFPLHHKMWQAQIAALTPLYRVVAIDLRDFGQSVLTETPSSMEFFVDDLMSVMNALHLDQVVLCGLSMGGYVALRAFERHPERFCGLILCNTRSDADTNEAKIKRSLAIKSLQENGLSAFAKDFVKNACAEQTFAEHPEVIACICDWIGENSVSSIAKALLALAARTDTTHTLAQIKVPTLILVGEFDHITPLAMSQALQSQIPNAKLGIIPKAGHLSAVENPSAFNAYLLEFMAKL